MGKANVRQFPVNTLIAAVVAFVACGPLGESPDEGENVDSVQEKGIREPLQQHVTDTLNGGAGPIIEDVPLTLASRTLPFDTRRDVFEDENPAVGQDPDRWNQEDVPDSDHQIVHGDRIVRRYGFQWLRSYARNSTVAFFAVDNECDPILGFPGKTTDPGQALRCNLQDFGPGTSVPLKLKDSPDPNHIAELEVAQRGLDICDTERFAEQVRGGNSGLAECTGTLIDKNLILTASHCIRNTQPNFGQTGDNNFSLKYRKRSVCPVADRVGAGGVSVGHASQS